MAEASPLLGGVKSALGIKPVAARPATVDPVAAGRSSLEKNLGSVQSIIVRQRLSLVEALFCGCYEAANIYDVYDKESGQLLFVALESGNHCIDRVCCAPDHSLVLSMKTAPADASPWSQLEEARLINSGPKGLDTAMMLERDGCVFNNGLCCVKGKPCLPLCVCGDGCKQTSYVHAGEVEGLTLAHGRSEEEQLGPSTMGTITCHRGASVMRRRKTFTKRP